MLLFEQNVGHSDIVLEDNIFPGYLSWSPSSMIGDRDFNQL